MGIKAMHIEDSCPRIFESKTCNKEPCPNAAAAEAEKQNQKELDDKKKEAQLMTEFNGQKKELEQWQKDEAEKMKMIKEITEDEEEGGFIDGEEDKAEEVQKHMAGAQQDAENEKDAIEIMKDETHSMQDLEIDASEIEERAQLRGAS